MFDRLKELTSLIEDHGTLPPSDSLKIGISTHCGTPDSDIVPPSPCVLFLNCRRMETTEQKFHGNLDENV